MLTNIIESCKYVVNNSEFVNINENKLNEFISEIKDVNLKHWLSFSPYGLLDLPVEKIINFLVVFESIDFSFWGNPKWTIETPTGKEDGSIALLFALLNYVIVNDSTDFSDITKYDFRKVLSGNIEIPLFKQRYNIIKSVSKIINKNMNGNFYEYTKNITNDTKLFNFIVTNFPSFKDERVYNGNKVYLYKLAQLLTSDILHIRKIKENIDVDYSNLVGCSDYKIPQVLRGLGILEYNKKLADIVDSKIEIEENSKFEVEIRAAVLVVINMIKEKLNNKVCSIDINDYIWGVSKSKNIILNPYHLTRTTNY